MSNIKEILLSEQTPSLTDYIRTLVGGKSRITELSAFNWPISQITGLLNALNGKARIESVAGLRGFFGFVNSNGDLNGSAYQLKNITADNINDAKNGIYMAYPSGFDAFDCGTVWWVIAGGNVSVGEDAGESIYGTPPVTEPLSGQQILVTDTGLYIRSFNGDIFSAPVYIGGSTTVRSFQREDLLDVVNNSQLTPGTPYKIIDHVGDAGIILTAATFNTFQSTAIRLTYAPKTYLVGTYYGHIWKGEWHESMTDLDFNTADWVTFLGRVWESKTGNKGTVSGWGLDSTNWQLIGYENADAYITEPHTCIYNITTNYVSKESDSRGNTYGMDVDDGSGLRTEYNIFNNPNVYGNNLGSVRGCRGGVIRNNNGDGSISSCSSANIDFVRIEGFSSYISDIENSSISLSVISGGYYISLYKNLIITGCSINGAINGDIEEGIYGDGLSVLSSKINGEIFKFKGIISGSDISGTLYNSTDCHITNSTISNSNINNVGEFNVINSKINQSSQLVDLSGVTNITNTIINNATISGCSNVSIEDSVLCSGTTLSNKTFAGFKIYSSNICGDFSATETFTADRCINKPVKANPTGGSIALEYVYEGNSLAITGGGSWNEGVLTGGAITSVRENEIDIQDASIVHIHHDGFYRIDYEVSALLAGISSATELEVAVFKNGSITNIARKITYLNSSSYTHSYLFGSLFLEAGDLLTLRYKLGTTSKTATVYNARIAVTYNN